MVYMYHSSDMASISVRRCGYIVRNFAIARLVGRNIRSNPLISQYSYGIDEKSIHPTLACGFHTSITNWKKQKKGAKKAVQEEETDTEEETDEEEDVNDDPLAKDFRTVDIQVNTLRLDAVAARALTVPRGSIEQLLLEGKIRVDGQLWKKKGAEVSPGMQLDFLVEPSPDNPDFTIIRRAILQKISDKADSHGRVTVTLRKWSSLTVADYKIGIM